MKILLFILFFFSSLLISRAQGHIETIKNQEYLKNASKVDCNNTDDDNLSARICANLAFQKADSSLVIIYNKLLDLAKKEHDSTMLKKLIKLQRTWRKMRDEHCEIVYDMYEGGHVQAIVFLNCLTELTNYRIKELRELYIHLTNP